MFKGAVLWSDQTLFVSSASTSIIITVVWNKTRTEVAWVVICYRNLYTKVATLNMERYLTGNQCRLFKIGDALVKRRC